MLHARSPAALSAAALLLLAAVGCATPCPAGSSRAADGLCTLPPADSGATAADGADGAGGTDGADGSDGGWDPADGFTEGDPITTAFSITETSDEFKYEWVDAAMIDARYGVVVGQGGWQVLDLDAGAPVALGAGPRGLRVATDGATMAVATREDRILRFDVTDPTAPIELASVFLEGDTPHEDVAMDAGRLLVGWTAEGAVLFDEGAAEVGRIPADHAFAVGLSGDRAVVTDGAEVGLWDVSDPAAPAELDRAALPSEGRDVAFDGARVLVGMGGYGVEVLTVTDDALASSGTVALPGAALGVALDGEFGWAATWETTAALWLGGEQPVVLGHEDPTESAFGVGARDGRALVADWFFATGLTREEGRAGAELIAPDTLTFLGDGEPAVVAVRNGGAFDLEVAVAAPDGFTVAPASLALEPGAAGNLVVTPPAGLAAESTPLPLSTNDPDEASHTVDLRLPTADIGAVHEPLELQGFQLPDTSLQTYRLADQRGSVVLLVYWALF